MERPLFEDMSTEELNDWWLDAVGYDALADGWGAQELLELCVGRFESEQGEVCHGCTVGAAGMNFREANLRNADVSGANLCRADLCRPNPAVARAGTRSIITPVLLAEGYIDWVHPYRRTGGTPVYLYGLDFDTPYCPVQFSSNQ